MRVTSRDILRIQANINLLEFYHFLTDNNFKVLRLIISVCNVDTSGQTSPLGRHPPRAETPRQTPPWPNTPILPSACWDKQPPLPSACWDRHRPCPVHARIHPLPATTAADGTHPTGMYSCYNECLS